MNYEVTNAVPSCKNTCLHPNQDTAENIALLVVVVIIFMMHLQDIVVVFRFSGNVGLCAGIVLFKMFSRLFFANKKLITSITLRTSKFGDVT